MTYFRNKYGGQCEKKEPGIPDDRFFVSIAAAQSLNILYPADSVIQKEGAPLFFFKPSIYKSR